MSGLTSNALTGNQLAEPIGQGNTATVSTLEVFNSVSGVVTTVSWDVDNGNACAGFTVAEDQSTGTFIPYVPPTTPSTHWYYYQGALINGAAVPEKVSALATISALSAQMESTLSLQFYLYGPNVDPNAHFRESQISCSVSGGSVTESSGNGVNPGIMLYDSALGDNGCDIGTNTDAMPFEFLYDSVQLVDLLDTWCGLNFGTYGNWCLDRTQSGSPVRLGIGNGCKTIAIHGSIPRGRLSTMA
jgi:hypothetical protein